MTLQDDFESTDIVPFDKDDMDPRILQVTHEYLALLESGHQPSKQDFINRFPDLHQEVAEYLEGIDLAHSLTASKTPSGPELASEPLGDFKIIREIGRGGMATVYEAVQLSLGRRVALKVLPFAASLDERQRQRFQIESHAAANLHHTNIVPVYAVGCERGVHYYAMQLIDGEPLSQWIVRLKEELVANEVTHSVLPITEATKQVTERSTMTETVTSTTSRADARQTRGRHQTIAKLIAQIADALDYAHTAGVIHRDIKPANLLIDIHGTGWITDFGLAQVATNSSITQTGDLLGTLRYMSPEQAGGKRTPVDHTTDIYSLGATLYELLCLQPIFAGTDRQQLYHSILHNDPHPLRQIDSSLPIELETIVMKTLSKSPIDRYATAADFAADLRRFLDERPILARRPTLIDHSRKWIRRHPMVVVSSFILLVVGVFGLSIATAAFSREQANTREALKREQQRSAEAEKRLILAQAAADEMIALAEFEVSEGPFEDGLRKKLLESALTHYQAIITEQENNPSAQERLQGTSDRVETLLADLTIVKADRESFILGIPPVLLDMKITKSQQQQLDDWFGQRRDQFGRDIRQFHSQKSDDIVVNYQTIRELKAQHARNFNEALTKILSDDQQKRLKQLSLQFQGSRALHESEVIQALQLSDQQRLALRAIESEYRFRSAIQNSQPHYNPRGLALPFEDPHPKESRPTGSPFGIPPPLLRANQIFNEEKSITEVVELAKDPFRRGREALLIENASEIDGPLLREGNTQMNFEQYQKIRNWDTSITSLFNQWISSQDHTELLPSLLGVLTNKQLEVWNTLIGEPYQPASINE